MLIWGWREAIYFSRGDWTGSIRLIWLGKFAFARMGFEEVAAPLPE
jgi:hypothetical protein